MHDLKTHPNYPQCQLHVSFKKKKFRLTVFFYVQNSITAPEWKLYSWNPLGLKKAMKSRKQKPRESDLRDQECEENY